MGAEIDYSDEILKLENVNKSFPGVKALSNMQITLARGEMHLESGLMTTVVLWQAYDLGYLAVNTAYAAVTGDIQPGDTEFVSLLSGTTQVEGVSTYPDAHTGDGSVVYLGGPATFTLDTLDCWKD